MTRPLVFVVVVSPGTTLTSEATSVTPTFCSCSAEAATIVRPTSESACLRFCAVTMISGMISACGDLPLAVTDSPPASEDESARSWLDHSAHRPSTTIGQRQTYMAALPKFFSFAPSTKATQKMLMFLDSRQGRADPPLFIVGVTQPRHQSSRESQRNEVKAARNTRHGSDRRLTQASA